MKNKNKKFGSGGGPRNLLIIVVVMLGCLAVLSSFYGNIRQKERATYTDFLVQVEKKQVRSVEIDGAAVKWMGAQDKEYEAIMPYAPTIMEQLGKSGVPVPFVESSAATLKKVYVAMGEPASSQFLAQRLRDFLGIDAEAAEENKVVILNCN